MKPRMPGRAARGFTLIEVLVAILIFSFGLLGFVGLQARSVQMSTDAENRNRAALLASDLTAIVTLNTTTSTSVVPAAAYADWVARVATPARGGLPNGVGVAASGASPNVTTVTITWTPPGNASTAQASQYTTQIVTNP